MCTGYIFPGNEQQQNINYCPNLMCKVNSLAPVVQKLNSAFHRINLYPADKYYPVDSGVHL